MKKGVWSPRFHGKVHVGQVRRRHNPVEGEKHSFAYEGDWKIMRSCHLGGPYFESFLPAKVGKSDMFGANVGYKPV